MSGRPVSSDSSGGGETLGWRELPELGARPRRPHWPVALTWLAIPLLAAGVWAAVWLAASGDTLG